MIYADFAKPPSEAVINLAAISQGQLGVTQPATEPAARLEGLLVWVGACGNGAMQRYLPVFQINVFAPPEVWNAAGARSWHR